MRGSRLPAGLAVVIALVAGAAAVARAAEESAKRPFRYDAGGRRDPFVPLIIGGRVISSGGRPSPHDLSKPVLRGILWDPGGQSIALIDDLEAKVGDTVRGYRVSAIRRDEVVLESEGQSVVLQIAFETPLSGTTTGGERP